MILQHSRNVATFGRSVFGSNAAQSSGIEAVILHRSLGKCPDNENFLGGESGHFPPLPTREMIR